MDRLPRNLIIYYDFLSKYTDQELLRYIGLFENEDSKKILRLSPYRIRELVVGRKLLAEALFKEKGISIHNCKIEKNSYGKPFLKNYEDISYNISHSNDIIVLAFSTCGAIGVDVEFVKNNYFDVMEEVFTRQEINWINSSDKEQKLERFFTIWTRKEAVIKGIGTGFSFPVKKISLHQDKPIERAILEWKYFTLPFEQDYVLSVAVRNTLDEIKINKMYREGVAINDIMDLSIIFNSK